MSIRDYKQRGVVVDRILDTERGIDIGERRERAAVVAWLRAQVSQAVSAGDLDLDWAADTIERGEHRRDFDVAALNAVLQKLSQEAP
jgi:hypothetical protein